MDKTIQKDHHFHHHRKLKDFKLKSFHMYNHILNNK